MRADEKTVDNLSYCCIECDIVSAEMKAVAESVVDVEAEAQSINDESLC